MKTANKRRYERPSTSRSRVRSVRDMVVRTHRSSARRERQRLAGQSHTLPSPRPVPREGVRVISKPAPDALHAAAIKNFEMAVRSFRRQNYVRAKQIFEKLAASAPPEVADRARVYLGYCTQKIGVRTIAPKTAADYQVLGVAELNARRLDSAIQHLAKAQKLDPKREDVRYALAAAHALRGDAESALEHLKVAIALRPQNRFLARSDEDFGPLAQDPRFQSLIASTGHANSGHLRT